MNCEPNDNLPQKIDINTFRDEAKPYPASVNPKVKAAAVKKTVHFVQSEYDIMPIMSYSNEYLTNVLSLKENEYLYCRWGQFLENIPDKYVHICLYSDFRKTELPRRRKSLNGNFYSTDNKLNPIPVMADPRQFTALKMKQIKQKNLDKSPKSLDEV